jgi:hypothetical protein
VQTIIDKTNTASTDKPVTFFVIHTPPHVSISNQYIIERPNRHIVSHKPRRCKDRHYIVLCRSLR